MSAFSNGTKNYVISDLNPSLAKLSITDSSSQYTVTLPNRQAVYVLGAIVNSGAAGASSPSGAYAALTDFWQAYRAHTTVRGGAAYTGVGTASAGSAVSTRTRRRNMPTTGSI